MKDNWFSFPGLRWGLACVYVLLKAAPALCADALPLATNSVGMVFVQLPAGEFLMGSPKDYADKMAEKVTYDWYRNSPPSETPQRKVRLSRPFEMGRTEVTLGQFRRFAEATGYKTDAERDGKGGAGRREGKWTEQSPGFSWRQMGYERSEDEPVVNVSWNDAIAFCEWLSKTDGRKHRLPTEAEWEYACRAGTTSPTPWPDDASRKDFAWSGDNSGGRPHAVAQLKPNAWGLFDMLGNAYEYCADGWSTNMAAALGKAGGSDLSDPLVPLSGLSVEIVVRSTSWGTNPLHCRSAFRGNAPKDHRNQRDGIRVARSAE